jgi:RNA polymerase sigma factor (sigma-70 family)
MPERELALAEAREILCAAIRELEPKNAFVVVHRYGFGTEEKTLRRIGEMLGVSGNRIRQRERKALRLLRIKLKHLETTWRDTRNA